MKLPSVARACVFCGNPRSHLILGIALKTGGVDEISVCAGCYVSVCQNSDEVAAQMWHCMREGLSSGYTDTGFAQLAWRTYTAFQGWCGVGISREKLDAASIAPKSGARWDAEIPYLLAAVPLTAALTKPSWAICRSRNPLTAGLAQAIAKVGPTIMMPPTFVWIDGRFAVAAVDDQGFGEQPPEVLQRALLVGVEAAYGNRDLMMLVANRGEDVSYEFIRRWIL